MPEQVRIEVSGSLGDLAPRWDDLVDAMALPSPFLHSWWVENASDARPVVVTVFEGERMIGGAPFQVDRIGAGMVGIERVRCLGQGDLAPDHLDVVAAPDGADRVAAAVIGWLARPGQRIVDLDGLAADGHLAALVGERVIATMAAPFARFDSPAGGAAGGAEYLSGRPGRLRSTVARTARRLTADGATVRQVDCADGSEVSRALAELRRLHEHRWQDGSGFLGSWDHFHRAASVGASDGRVSITEVCDSSGVAVAVEVDLVAGDRIAFYQSGRSTDRRWRGAGSLLRERIIRSAVEEGFREYDLLRGDEPYKEDWATGRRSLVRVRFGIGTLGRAAARSVERWRRIRTRTERLRRPADVG